MRKMRKKWIIFCLCAALAIGWFAISIDRLEQGRQEEGKCILEESLRRTAVACYGAEGFYPPDVAYMQNHYGLQYDAQKYQIHYEIFASNLMPDITVIEKEK